MIGQMGKATGAFEVTATEDETFFEPDKLKEFDAVVFLNTTGEDGFYAIAWLDEREKGRIFYCSLGHRDEIYWNSAVLNHYLAGIQYALGDLDADASPKKVADLGFLPGTKNIASR